LLLLEFLFGKQLVDLSLIETVRLLAELTTDGYFTLFVEDTLQFGFTQLVQCIANPVF
jgi:hypothetical protein